MTTKRKRHFRREGCFTVYMLKCGDGSFYTGYTGDLAARLRLHRAGRGSKYVRARLPARLVYTREYRYYKLAVAEELRIKGLSRVQKTALVIAYRKAGKTIKKAAKRRQ